jgi:phage tail sheath gpL-like
MAQLNVLIDTDLSVATLTRDYQRPLSSKYADVQAISQLLQSILSGNQPGTPPSVTVTAYADDNYGTGSFGLVSVIAGNTCTINGVSFAAVASGATGNQFNVGVSDTATAVNLAATINASVTALVQGCVEATSVSNVVYLAASAPGLIGNQTAIASGQASIIASASRLTGGDADTDEKVYTF